jgi:hypothetical protein
MMDDDEKMRTQCQSSGRVEGSSCVMMTTMMRRSMEACRRVGVQFRSSGGVAARSGGSSSEV